jgi:hypothetical protein
MLQIHDNSILDQFSRSSRFRSSRHGGLVVYARGLAIVLVLLPCTQRAQAQNTNLFDADTAIVLPSTAYLFAGVAGFLPFNQSYRLNYSTSLAGLPIEVNGGLSFPINEKTVVPFTVRYIRRTVTLIPGMDLKMFDFEPGVRVFLEKYTPKEFRFYGGASLILAEATVTAQYNASQDGLTTTPATASKEYLNLGVGFDLGLSYPLTQMTAIDFGAHLGILLLDPEAHGGLGNIGGVSLGGAYRFGF